MSGWIFIASVIVGIVTAAIMLPKQRATFDVGGIYSIEGDDEKYGIVKLLVHEDGIFHVRLYKQKYKIRPVSIDLTTLTLGTIHDADGYGMGHMPLSDDTFTTWKPVLITKTTVIPEELAGYTIWKEDGNGGAF